MGGGGGGGGLHSEKDAFFARAFAKVSKDFWPSVRPSVRPPACLSFHVIAHRNHYTLVLGLHNLFKSSFCCFLAQMP